MANKSENHRIRQAHLTIQRRAEIAKLYREKLSHREIGERLGISKQAVGKHIRTMNAKARESAETDLVMARAEALQDHSYIYGEAMAAWHKSDKAPADTKYLAICLVALQAIRAIRGLDAPKKQEISGNLEVSDMSTMDDRQLEEVIRNAAGMIPPGVMLLPAPQGSNGNGSNGGLH